MIFLAFGLTEKEVGPVIKKTVAALNLDYPEYRVAFLPAITVYNDEGNEEEGDGRALWLPGLLDVRKGNTKMFQLSIDLGFPVTYIDASVHAYIEGNAFI